MLVGREHPADAAARPIGLEQEAAGRRGERPAREIPPGEPARMVRIGLRTARQADILHRAFGAAWNVAHAARSLGWSRPVKRPGFLAGRGPSSGPASWLVAARHAARLLVWSRPVKRPAPQSVSWSRRSPWPGSGPSGR